jgi:S1-C subfamily serine protease
LNHLRSVATATATALVVLALAPGVPLRAQRIQPKEGATLILDGVVREIFRSERRTTTDLIVQIAVTRAELGQDRDPAARVDVPAPGDVAYVHIQVPSAPGGTFRPPPPERSQVRVYLRPRPQGGWTGTFPEWFELTSPDLAAVTPNDPEPPADAAMASNSTTTTIPTTTTPPAGNRSILDQLGIEAGILKAGAGDRIGLQVTKVQPDRPGARAGLEVGDLIIGLGKDPITSIETMTEQARREGPDLTLIVFDKNTKKAVPVPIRLDAIAAAPTNPNPAPDPDTVAVTPRLGLNASVLYVRDRKAIRVTEVKPVGPAKNAGIEVGDIIMGVGRQAIESIEAFNRQIEAARGSITLAIRDVNRGEVVPVEVKLDAAMAAPAPNPPTTPGLNIPIDPAPVGALGVTVEPADDKGIPTIRVAQVVPSGEAARAGLKRGDIIESVNDTIIFDPDHFNEVVARAGRSIKLIVKDARTGRKSPIEIDLSRR